ncbi:hypothetical protein [Conexibacter arvalis]|uniref:Fermentation-respiration switch protein FrsA (DUF1100 family) n=1 Tax=Conexibacter arvalis TaxID=912552 RepID=A0A840IEY6_9ACTN|nr:hypothetical protein [Conexibacter arvalis]MBB4663376.1 fermentation-respiration switch protein FrsA (DUF1100 family) [Conexibacter arvalis]
MSRSTEKQWMGRRIVAGAVAAALAAACGWAATVAVAPAARRAAQAPSMTVRPRAARQGGTVVLHGSGFAPRARVVLLAGPPGGARTRIGRADTDRAGEFVAPITILRAVRPGRYVAYACRHRCRVMASAPFRVRASR